MHVRARSAGRDYEGVSYVSEVPFVIVDLINLRTMNIDVNDKSASTIGKLYYRIGEKSKTLGFPAGVCPTVGVGGHFSGAGYCTMMRKYGLSSDSIVDARLIYANGTILDRTLEQNATKLIHKWQNVAPRFHEDLFIRIIINSLNSSDQGGNNKLTYIFSFIQLLILWWNQMITSHHARKFPCIRVEKRRLH
ncbi:hypothetical protein H5410_033101 [Solanum commersonii]|uniref:FAD linked oxidase N-terminal domain-containing protein n=1 Tax=Solanum commersonii TaxID=4109 RepID=A0A9J5YLV0_SOLCO|nr:hypothetical protein H5410_033101 [Solanum commersonii]